MDDDNDRPCFFLSHTSRDKGVALCVARLLRQHGCDYWIDFIHSRRAPAESVFSAIDNASWFVAIVSQNYVKSKWCMMEMGHARGEKKNIVCLRIERPPANSFVYIHQQLAPKFGFRAPDFPVYFPDLLGTSTRSGSSDEPVSVEYEIKELFNLKLNLRLTSQEKKDLKGWVQNFALEDMQYYDVESMENFVNDADGAESSENGEAVFHDDGDDDDNALSLEPLFLRDMTSQELGVAKHGMILHHSAPSLTNHTRCVVSDREKKGQPSQPRRRCNSTRKRLSGCLCVLINALCCVLGFSAGGTIGVLLYAFDTPPVTNNKRQKKTNQKNSTRNCRTNQIHVGFDSSEAIGAHRSGVVFKDLHGTPKDPIKIFADHNYTWSRVRIMVDPPGNYGLFQNITYVKETVTALKSQGIKVLLDYHFSSWWAYSSNQWIPESWREERDPPDIGVGELRDRVYDHVETTFQELKANLIMPDAVQFGNEITNGMLWPAGYVNVTANGKDRQWRDLANLTNVARQAMLNVVGQDDAPPKIVVHLSSGGDAKLTEDWLRRFRDAGGYFDLIGLSYYPMWQGSYDQLKENLRNLEREYPENDVWLLETGYFWTLSDNTLKMLQTPVDQENYLKDLRAILEEYGRNTAVFYMASCFTQQHKWMGVEDFWDVAQRALFDENAQALRAISALGPTGRTCVNGDW